MLEVSRHRSAVRRSRLSMRCPEASRSLGLDLGRVFRQPSAFTVPRERALRSPNVDAVSNARSVYSAPSRSCRREEGRRRHRRVGLDSCRSCSSRSRVLASRPHCTCFNLLKPVGWARRRTRLRHLPTSSILSSSSDLHGTEEWREEVLRRCGEMSACMSPEEALDQVRSNVTEMDPH